MTENNDISPPLALLWDESHIWGLLLEHALTSLGLPFSCLTAQEVAAGALRKNRPKLLLVPGGWAKLKSHSLGHGGREAIRRYLTNGGWYLGFCGGAGLGLSTSTITDSLGVCPWKRAPAKDRLPNFSGRVKVRLNIDDSLPLPPREDTITLPVWWPSQFQARDDCVRIIARYLAPAENFWVSDLDINSSSSAQLSAWEKVYKIPLQPSRIVDEPCMIAGFVGRGGYILSYAHLETPQQPQANALFQDIIQGICAQRMPMAGNVVPEWNLRQAYPRWEDPYLATMRTSLHDLIDVGVSNFLLTWRSSWLLGWRRGIPGLAVNTLLAYLTRLGRNLPSPRLNAFWRDMAPSLSEHMREFVVEMRGYLLEERLLLAHVASSPERSGAKELQRLRKRLVGSFPGYGGRYAKIVNDLDAACLMACRTAYPEE